MSLADRPGIEGPAHRGVAEAVDGYRLRVDSTSAINPDLAGQTGLERPRRDRGEVGLQQHVVERCGKDGVEGGHDLARHRGAPGHP